VKRPPLTEDQRALVAENTGLAKAVANKWAKYANDWTDPDDLVSEALAGLCRAAQTWDPAKGAKFSTYGWCWAEQNVRRFLNEERGRGVNIPEHRRDVQIGVAGFGSMGDEAGDFAGLIPDRGPDPREAPPAEATVWDAVEWMLDDERQRKVLRARFVDGRKLDDIAAELGVSKERIRQIEVKALAELSAEKELLAELLAG